ncbi:MAG: Ig-like domain-containing protein, partial [Terriglobales bacterium]
FQPIFLAPLTTYTATVYGTVQDYFGNAMGANYSWSFTTAAPPPDSGPGGPILVIADTGNPFTHYYGEILLAEGMNEFLIKDISTITPAVLAQYDVAILSDMTLLPFQASMFTTWVEGGGNLIAMHPDPQLAGLLGLTSLGSSMNNIQEYLAVNTGMAPGAGIVASTIQFHGPADLYSVNGATAVATLYSDATTATTSPAVTLTSAGAGQAAAFTYDLARSVVYTRQGNPAWSGEARDSSSVEIRAYDLFYGDATFDPEPDWVDLSKVQIPQADEQQRLLVNLIQQMNTAKKPLPRFWYLPSGFKAAVVMTGDDHYSDNTSPRFDQYIADSPAGCSVADWTCVRATSYVWPNNFVVANYQSYVAQGFEIANHGDNWTSCTTYTPASLDEGITYQLASMTATYPDLAASQTNRTHCVLWSDYDSQPQILLNHGIRLDTSYYYWPDPWVQDRPGFFTGSALPMRYADQYGNTMDIYQAVTQFPDETTWTFPTDINTVLNNALGAPGFYAVITPNDHTDFADSPDSDAIVAAAQAVGVPIVSALQMLQWLDGRNTSTFGSESWSGNTLSFTISVGTNANNLQAMLPVNCSAGALTNLTRAGASVGYTTQTIKGIQYAFFVASAGSYQATYTGSSSKGVMKTPTPSTTLSGASVTFDWTAGTGATAYWLDVGNVAGGNQYEQSGNLGNVFTITVNGLPTDGSTVYVTLYSLVSGQWVNNEYSYTALGGSSGKGVMTTPPPSTTLSGSSVTFDWTAGAGASGYWLDIGSAAGGNQYEQSGNLGNVFTKAVNGLPVDGSTVYVTLYSLIGEQWFSNAYTYRALGGSSSKGVLTTPSPTSILTANRVTFDWTAGTAASAYWLDVGNVIGGNQWYQSGSTTALTTTAPNLPADGSTLFATLYSLVGGVWVSNAYTYTAAQGAVMTAPVPGTTL